MGGIYVIISRYVTFGEVGFSPVLYLSEVRSDYFSAKSISQIYQNLAVAEAGLITFSAARLLLLCRVNRHIFLIISTVGKALEKALMFYIAFVPILAGFVAVAHALWSDSAKKHDTILGSFVDTIMFCYGLVEEDGSDLSGLHRSTSALFLYSFLFFVVQVLCLNGWIAILVEVYQKRRIEAGFWPSMYKWTEWSYISWGLWTPPRFVYLKVNEKLGRKIERPKEDDAG